MAIAGKFKGDVGSILRSECNVLWDKFPAKIYSRQSDYMLYRKGEGEECKPTSRRALLLGGFNEKIWENTCEESNRECNEERSVHAAIITTPGKELRAPKTERKFSVRHLERKESACYKKIGNNDEESKRGLPPLPLAIRCQCYPKQECLADAIELNRTSIEKAT